MAGGEISRAEHLSLPPTISEEPMKAKILVLFYLLFISLRMAKKWLEQRSVLAVYSGC
jgi:hypothetical protein